ncbi:MAG TPA: folylpolyglutamate synthase/dihydrofolate synthase family protein [Vicinamibacterales bacterium]|nr:folylpolyglutamate synthase/dihydrofolate synthase family protein [Vicinamibacterales bacterium]
MSHGAYLQSLELIGVKLGLEQIRALVAALGHPDRAFPSIVIAGTNGKGSVTAMVERGLRAAGYRTGRYTSPHLVDLHERFAIGGRPISDDQLEEVAGRIRAAAASLPSPPTFFEATTALALEVFRDEHVDVAVLEVGLGGRLDATNVVEPVGVAITAVDLDHEQYLGSTIEEIAGEKAGVIKPGALVVLADNPPAVRRVVATAAERVGAPLVFAPDGVETAWTMVEGRARLTLATPRHRYGPVTLALRGRHQIANAVAAVRLLEELAARGTFEAPPAAIVEGLTAVDWPARLEYGFWRGRTVIVDGAHNPAGARALASYLVETYGRRLPLVVGVMRDKKIDAMLEAFAPAASHFVFTAAAGSRAAAPHELAAIARGVAPDVPIVEIASPADALAHAVTLGDPIVVAGSLYLAGEVRARIWYPSTTAAPPANV